MGSLWTIGLNGGLAVGAYLAARDAFRQPPGWPRGLAAVVLAWAWVTGGLELLGSTGRMDRPGLALWVALGVGLALASRFVGHATAAPDRMAGGESDSGRDDGEWGPWIALGLVLWACLIVGMPSLLGPVKVVSDGPIYHLYFASRWWKAARLELVAAPFGETAATYFPAVGDLWFAWLMIGWGGDLLAKVGQVPFLLVAGLTSVAIARRLGAGRNSSALAAAWFITSMPLLVFSFEANVDTIFVAGVLLACYFGLRYGLGDDGLGALLLASLAAGAALGTKAIGVVFVPPLVLVGMWLVWRRSERWGEASLSWVAGLVGLLALPGFFYARNARLTGNPLYPLHLEMGGRVILTGWYGRDAMRFSPYYLPVGLVGALGDILLAVLDPRLAPVWVVALVMGVVGGLRRPGTSTGRAIGLFAILAVVNVALYWLVVPYRTQQRFMLQALGLAVAPLAALLDRSRGLRRLALGLLAVHLLTPQAWPFTRRDADPPWDLSRAVPNRIPGLIPFPATADELRTLVGDGPRLAGWSLTALLGLGSLAVGCAWWRLGRGPTLGRWAVASLGTTVLVAAAVVVNAPGWPDERRCFFPPFPDYYRGWLALDQRAGPAGARVAYAGTDLPYYLQGVGLRNPVSYINIDDHPDWLLHDYHRAASTRPGRPATWDDTRPGWDRLRPDFNAWLANLRRAGIQLLVVTRANPDEGRQNPVAAAGGFPIERLWADAHPETFEPLYGEAERDPLFRLYRVKPPTR